MILSPRTQMHKYIHLPKIKTDSSALNLCLPLNLKDPYNRTSTSTQELTLVTSKKDDNNLPQDRYPGLICICGLDRHKWGWLGMIGELMVCHLGSCEAGEYRMQYLIAAERYRPRMFVMLSDRRAVLQDRRPIMDDGSRDDG